MLGFMQGKLRRFCNWLLAQSRLRVSKLRIANFSGVCILLGKNDVALPRRSSSIGGRLSSCLMRVWPHQHRREDSPFEDGPKDFTVEFMKTGATAEALAFVFLLLALSICWIECCWHWASARRELHMVCHFVREVRLWAHQPAITMRQVTPGALLVFCLREVFSGLEQHDWRVMVSVVCCSQLCFVCTSKNCGKMLSTKQSSNLLIRFLLERCPVGSNKRLASHG